MKIETRAVHGCRGFDPHTGAVSFPIYQSATFRHPGLLKSTGYDYSRLQNPTREELEDTIALLESGKKGFAFASGMAAVSAVLTLFPTGSHIIATDDLYGGTYRLFQEIFNNYGIEFSYIDTRYLSEVEKAIKPNTKAFFLETPSNPMMKVADIALIAALAKSKGILTIVDNTFLTPYLQRPIELGADIVIHSGTKYLAGHNDTLSGFVVSNSDQLTERLLLIQKSQGAVLAPFDSWLLLRGIKTLGVRIDRQQQNAIAVANWLKNHENVENVYFVGLPEHEGYEISKKQSSGFGAMISFTLKNSSWVESVLEKVKTVIFAESLGGVESLITYPVIQTHSYIPKDIRDSLGVTDKLLRLSVGIEHIDDIIEDLDQALSH